MVVTETTEDVFLKTLLLFDEDRVLFGTDSPWTDQKAMVEHARALKLPDGRKEKLLRGNAVRLQGLPG
jgi:predicted TIM-barrel fold metal-dependent hydrolase